jgi:hypothetical protein
MKELLPLPSPSCPLNTRISRPQCPGTPGLCSQRLGSLPPKRAPARLTFLTSCIRYLLGR